MKGRASTIEQLGQGRILRIGGDPAREARLMALAASHGYPVPRVHEVRDDGLVLELIPGRTMAAELMRAPWRSGRQMSTLAGLHETLHRIPLDGGSLLHLDLHPENVIISPSGPVVIDWTNARSGDALEDVALTWLILATSAGMPGRLLARQFASRVGVGAVREGIDAARAFRLADANVTDAERARVRRAVA